MPNFTYTRDRPAGDLSPSSQRTTLTTNTNSTDSILNVDLFGFNDNNGGFHQKSTYVVQGSDPVPVNTNGAQAIEYSKTISGIAELFVTRFGSVTPIQLTSGSTIAASVGQTFLPGGLQLKWGTVGINGSGSVSYTGIGLTDFPTNTLVVLLTAQSNSRYYSWSSPTASGFNIGANTGGLASVTFLAIGH